MAQNKCFDTITELLNKYDGNDYIKHRIFTHIVMCLPKIIENESKNYNKRIIRNNYLTHEQNVFMQIFLSENKYYYLPNNNLFYEYDNERYLIVKEDDVIHQLLSTISKNKVLLQWKYKTKTNIIKQIKERNLFSSIPESITIQNVLNTIYPSFFSSKKTAKYFLTIIGDNILKKNNNIIFLVTQKMKQFLNELDNVAVVSIGNNATTNNFVTKYHENHCYENYRLIKINENFTNNVWREMLKKIGLDLLCVSAHYSKRYENSDKFIENNSDDELKTYTYYLKNTTPINIVSDFCDKYIIETNKDYKMDWKSFHFIWKQFLSNYNLPNVIYLNTLKTFIKNKYSYSETDDFFTGITSKYLPLYSDFIKFWENTINVIDYDDANPFVYEIEIDEISALFKFWCKQNTEHILSNSNITEDNILKVLKHFFPSTEIIEEKFILNVTSSIWNKIEDITNSFEFIKNKIQNEHKLSLISLDDVYNYYYKFCKNNSLVFIVSKPFFEKYLYYKLENYIVHKNFIKIEWIYENNI